MRVLDDDAGRALGVAGVPPGRGGDAEEGTGGAPLGAAGREVDGDEVLAGRAGAAARLVGGDEEAAVVEEAAGRDDAGLTLGGRRRASGTSPGSEALQPSDLRSATSTGAPSPATATSYWPGRVPSSARRSSGEMSSETTQEPRSGASVTAPTASPAASWTVTAPSATT
ncbi:hypothetical protein [Actinomyces radicidentis]|uniref:hypothetical protein n=1 Tax=Actinomyces radicidentis TaxID=111015 RepID=UPI0028E6AC9F|nr:hypothetical protein [Actinomyces radicidentis]